MLTTEDTDETDEHGSNPSVAFNPRQSVVSVSSVVNPFSFLLRVLRGLFSPFFACRNYFQEVGMDLRVVGQFGMEGGGKQSTLLHGHDFIAEMA